jgi:hypothetical protein
MVRKGSPVRVRQRASKTRWKRPFVHVLRRSNDRWATAGLGTFRTVRVITVSRLRGFTGLCLPFVLDLRGQPRWPCPQVEFRELRVLLALAEHHHFGPCLEDQLGPSPRQTPCLTFRSGTCRRMSAGLVWRAGRETPAIRTFAQAAADTVAAA